MSARPFVSARLETEFSSSIASSKVIMFAAPFGSGKSVVARELLRRMGKDYVELSASDPCFTQRIKELLQSLSDDMQFKDVWDIADLEVRDLEIVVLVDDLEALHDDPDADFLLSEFVAESPFIRWVLCGHCALPRWALPYVDMDLVTTFDVSDLVFNDQMLSDLLASKKVLLSQEDRNKLMNRTLGFPVLVIDVVDEAADSTEEMPFSKCLQQVMERFSLTFMEKVRQRVSSAELEIMLALSPFERFDAGLIEELTQNPGAHLILQDWIRRTCMLEEHRGTASYSFWPILRDLLFSMMEQNWDAARQRHLYECAGRYFADCGDYVQAVYCADRLGDKDTLISLLEKHSRLNPRQGSYRELAPYYLALSHETIASSAELMSGMSMLGLLRCDLSESDHWYDQLVLYAQRSDISSRERRRARREIAYLDIALMHHEKVNIIEGILAMARSVGAGDAAFSMSVTSGMPSILNGGRDFSEWSKHDTFIYDLLRHPVSLVLGRDSIGLPKCSLLECRFMRGEGTEQLSLDVASSLPEIHFSGTPDIEFAAVGLLVSRQIKATLQRLGLWFMP